MAFKKWWPFFFFFFGHQKIFGDKYYGNYKLAKKLRGKGNEKSQKENLKTEKHGQDEKEMKFKT